MNFSSYLKNSSNLMFMLSSLITVCANYTEYIAIAKVPVVNRCTYMPKLIRKVWFYRNTFQVILKETDEVFFELVISQQDFANTDFEITFSCLANTATPPMKVKLNKEMLWQRITIKETCVPTVSVLEFCNSRALNATVLLKSHKPYEILPTLLIDSFDTYDVDDEEISEFLNRIRYYGFVTTPRIQILLNYAEVEELKHCDCLISGLARINDAFAEFGQYSGYTTIPYKRSNIRPRMNNQMENDVVLLLQGKLNGQWDYESNKEQMLRYHFTVTNLLSSKFLGSFAITASHFTTFITDPFFVNYHGWEGSYAVRYVSKFQNENSKDYQWQQNAEYIRGNYDNKSVTLENFFFDEIIHFSIALFSIDDRESLLRAYNIHALDEETAIENTLQSIAIFLKDAYDLNVFPFIDRVVNKKITWLNITNVFEIAESSDFRMPCFYFNSSIESGPSKKFLDHDFATQTCLRLCPTQQRNRFTTLKIHFENGESVLNKIIMINNMKINVTTTPFVYQSTHTTFVVSAQLNNTAVILPTYIFCEPLLTQVSSGCELKPNITTYHKNNSLSILPSDTFYIYMVSYDEFKTIVQIDYSEKEIVIKSQVNQEKYFLEKENLHYLTIKVYDSLGTQIVSNDFFTNERLNKEEIITFHVGYIVLFIARKPDLVKIFDKTLIDLGSSVFRITSKGLKILPSNVIYILGTSQDEIISILYVDYCSNRIIIQTYTTDVNPNFFKREDVHLTIRLPDLQRRGIHSHSFDIYRSETRNTREEFSFEVGDTISFHANDLDRVIIGKQSLRNLSRSEVKITSQGFDTNDSLDSNTLIKAKYNTLRSDLEYRPNLNKNLYINWLLDLLDYNKSDTGDSSTSSAVNSWHCGASQTSGKFKPPYSDNSTLTNNTQKPDDTKNRTTPTTGSASFDLLEDENASKIIAVLLVILVLLIITIIYFIIKQISAFKTYIKKVVIEQQIDQEDDTSDSMRMPIVTIQRIHVDRVTQGEISQDYEMPLFEEWEFPRENLHLECVLGEGEFGKVYQAKATGILDEDEVVTVAVKMLKDKCNDGDMISLVSEMEMMKQMGRHVNILTLLGCCSQKGPLYVITELAERGNLQNHLRSLPRNMDRTMQKTLIGYATQIAQGMEYLTSIRCVHRDLAARNVLMTRDYIMKIADFGLAKDVHGTYYYRKKNSREKLPIKWMAPEAIFCNRFTIKSDVWSYGVLLWEIQTLGGIPYPLYNDMKKLCQHIARGYRMEKPENCSIQIYTIMRVCWSQEPQERPDFSTIINSLNEISTSFEMNSEDQEAACSAKSPEGSSELDPLME